MLRKFWQKGSLYLTVKSAEVKNKTVTYHEYNVRSLHEYMRADTSCIRKCTQKREIPVLLLVLRCVLVCIFLTFLRCFSILSRHQYAKQQGNAHNMQLVLQVTLNKQQLFFCPSCVCLSFLPLTGHKTSFPANVWSRTLTMS